MRVLVRPLFCKKCGAEQIRYAKICCCGRGVHCAPAFTLCKRRLYKKLVFLLKRLFCVLYLFQAAGRGFMSRRIRESGLMRAKGCMAE